MAPLAFFLSIGGLVGAQIANSVFYDNSAPIGNLSQVALTPSVKVGGVFVYQALYDKRADCKAISGHYQIDGTTATGAEITVKPFQIRTDGKWAVGKKQTARVAVVMPEAIPPGAYEMWWAWAYSCKRAKRLLKVISPRIPVQITAK